MLAALRQLDRAEGVFGPGVATLLAAPWAMTPAERQVKPPVNLAHVLHNMGWHDEGQLRGPLAAWRGLFALVKPDAVVFNHAPTGGSTTRTGWRRGTCSGHNCRPRPPRRALWRLAGRC